MTTPNHRPYLTATDLRTPEDVLAAMDAEAASWTEPGIEHGTELVRFDVAVSQTLATAAKYVRARLDRERRQACRRAALVYIARARHHHESAREWAESEPDASFTRAMLYEWAEAARACCRDSIALALTFRAAARTP